MIWYNYGYSYNIKQIFTTQILVHFNPPDFKRSLLLKFLFIFQDHILQGTVGNVKVAINTDKQTIGPSDIVILQYRDGQAIRIHSKDTVILKVGKVNMLFVVNPDAIAEWTESYHPDQSCQLFTSLVPDQYKHEPASDTGQYRPWQQNRHTFPRDRHRTIYSGADFVQTQQDRKQNEYCQQLPHRLL